jgi:uncharacterized damage-inducible protein DinB
MANSVLDSGLSALAFSRRFLLQLLEDIPEDKLCHAPSPGANHACWVMGHMVTTDDYFLATVGGKSPNVPEGWRELFAMGSKPSANRADYPSTDELKSAMSDRREALLLWFKSMDAATQAEPLTGDLTGFAPNKAGIMFTLAWHEGLHTGQVSSIRRSLGMPPKLG